MPISKSLISLCPLLRFKATTGKMLGIRLGRMISCSALKEKYRTVLADGISIPVYWVFLKGSYELIEKRMKERTDHFMPDGLLQSQFEILETPVYAIVADIADSQDKIIESLLTSLPV